MNGALKRCGFNAPTVIYLIAQGLAMPNDLMLASESDLDSIARDVARTPPRGTGKEAMPFIAVNNLKGFRFWTDERKRTGLDADPESFTADIVPLFTAKRQEYQEQKKAAKGQRSVQARQFEEVDTLGAVEQFIPELSPPDSQHSKDSACLLN
jgi:hypothetical protein